MINSRIRRAYNAAYRQAMSKLENKSNHKDRSRNHGAAVIRGSRIIGSGSNSYNRNYVGGIFYTSLHAELAALHNSGLRSPIGSGQCSKINHLGNIGFERIQYWRNPPRRFQKTRNIDLLVLQVNKFGECKMSRPCNGCIRILRLYGIRRVYYTTDNGQLVSEKVREMF